MSKLYRQTDVQPHGLMNKRVVVIGYGSQGRGQAMNLRDSGVDVRVATRTDGPSWMQAVEDGWTPLDLDQAHDADIVCLLTPDMVQPEIYTEYLAGKLSPGTTVLFSHGFNVHYGFTQFPEDINVVMVAPKGPGFLVRREFESGSGVPCLLAVHQDSDGTAFGDALAYADAIGGTRAGVIETSFREETETDLFGEQAVLCGGVTELVVAGWETLVEAGYSKDIAYFECLHELKLIVDLLYEGGLAKMHQYVSDTAKYGDLTRGPQVVTDETRARLKDILTQIQNGEFAKEWRAEYENGMSEYKRLLDEDLTHDIESTGSELRKHFSWLKREEQPAS